MELEELTKNQIILLATLISFVTSMATGIITVSLMSEAPLTVTQTIQRVVERTIEKVTPDNKTTTVKETTVVVKEEDLMTKAVTDNEKSLVRIGKNLKDDNQFTFVSLGIILSPDGTIITDGDLISPDGSYYARTQDGLVVPLEVIRSLSGKNMVFLKAVLNEGVKLNPVNAGNSDLLKLGQTALAISGEKSSEVIVGIFSNLIKEKTVLSDGKAGQDIVAKIRTNLNFKNSSSGGPLINLMGEVVGMNIVNQNSEFTIPMNIIKKELDNLSVPQASNNKDITKMPPVEQNTVNTANIVNTVDGSAINNN